MTLGLGPGIDYAAVGEALAMGEAIGSWADACDRANAQVDLANQIIARKNDEIERLAAEAAGLGCASDWRARRRSPRSCRRHNPRWGMPDAGWTISKPPAGPSRMASGR